MQLHSTTAEPGMLWVSRARIWLKVVLKSGLGVIGIVWGAFAPPRPGLRVLLYHRVNPHRFDQLGPVSREISVRPAAFERQLRLLRKQGWRTLGPDELHATVLGERELQRRDIVITFDDGYEDNLRWAAPLLREHGFVAVVFVTTTRFGQDSDAAGWGSDAPGCGRFLSVAQLQQWLDLGLHLGSHTHTHTLAGQLDEAGLLDEYQRSRQLLEHGFGRPVRLLAYPDGSHDARAQAAAARAGYIASFTTTPGLNRADTPPHALRRTEVSASDPFWVFRMKLRGALDWLWFKESPRLRDAVRLSNRFLVRLLTKERE